MSPIIRITNLWKQYSGNTGKNQAALRGVNLEINSGESIVLFGKSGSGKTTLLNLIAGLDNPTEGTIEIDGMALHSQGDRGLTKWRRSKTTQPFATVPPASFFP